MGNVKALLDNLAPSADVPEDCRRPTKGGFRPTTDTPDSLRVSVTSASSAFTLKVLDAIMPGRSLPIDDQYR